MSELEKELERLKRRVERLEQEQAPLYWPSAPSQPIKIEPILRIPFHWESGYITC